MHEVGVLMGLLDQLAVQLADEGSVRLETVGLRIGCRAGIDISALRFAFEATRDDHPLLASTTELIIETVACQRSCRDCNHVWQTDDAIGACPVCASFNCIAHGGDELILERIEVCDV